MMIVEKTDLKPIQNQNDIVLIRKAVKEWSVELKFGLTDQTKIVTAASELARNTYDYGKGGSMKMEALAEMARRGLRLTFEDNGPGIPDLDLALTDGYTSGKGLGMGLSGSKRLVNEFEIESKVGMGTKITITKWNK